MKAHALECISKLPTHSDMIHTFRESSTFTRYMVSFTRKTEPKEVRLFALKTLLWCRDYIVEDNPRSVRKSLSIIRENLYDPDSEIVRGTAKFIEYFMRSGEDEEFAEEVCNVFEDNAMLPYVAELLNKDNLLQQAGILIWKAFAGSPAGEYFILDHFDELGVWDKVAGFISNRENLKLQELSLVLLTELYDNVTHIPTKVLDSVNSLAREKDLSVKVKAKLHSAIIALFRSKDYCWIESLLKDQVLVQFMMATLSDSNTKPYVQHDIIHSLKRLIKVGESRKEPHARRNPFCQMLYENIDVISLVTLMSKPFPENSLVPLYTKKLLCCIDSGCIEYLTM